jgi:hypothetical protein
MAKKRKVDANPSAPKALGFDIGADVVFSNRYFANHNMKYIDFGAGKVRGEVTSRKSVPKVIVSFPYNRAFFEKPLSDMLAANNDMNKFKVLTILEIYPAYLEKA